MSEFIPPRPLELNFYQVLQHTNELLDIARSHNPAQLEKRDAELTEAYGLAIQEDNTNEQLVVKQRIQRQDHVRLHGAAAKKYLQAMGDHDNLVWCNNDTELGQQVGMYILAAPSPPIQHFISDTDPRIKAILQDGTSIIHETLADEKPHNIPTTSFVGAIGIEEGWAKGRTNVGKEDPIENRTYSGETMVSKYASMPAESAPEVMSAAGIVQPDGSIVYVSENAHRTAAAVIRGDSHIKVRQVRLYFSQEMLIL